MCELGEWWELTARYDRLPSSAPLSAAPECGSVYKMSYVGPEDHGHDDHGHDHHGYEEPKNFSDFVKPQYW